MSDNDTECLKCEVFAKLIFKKDNQIGNLKKEVQELKVLLEEYKEKKQNAKEIGIQTEVIECNESQNTESTSVQELDSGEYIYDENFKMYYCKSNGYYYDSNLQLFYSPQTCSYYQYNYETTLYEEAKNAQSSTISQSVDESCENVLIGVGSLSLEDDDGTLSAISDEKEEPNKVASSASVINDDTFMSNKSNYDDGFVEEKSVADEAPEVSDWQLPEGSNLTVKDLVTEVAEQTIEQNDYVYDEKSQMYYSLTTGYYFDTVKKLLYDPNTGSYYKYDEETRSYEHYSNVDPVAEKLKVKNTRLKARRKYWKKRKEKEVIQEDGSKADSSPSKKETEVPKEKTEVLKKKNKVPKKKTEVPKKEEVEFSSPEDGEIMSSESEGESPVEIEPSQTDKNLMSSYVPCIRAIVEKAENLRVGSLLLISCTGATIGRDKACSLYIPEISVSKEHAEVTFCYELSRYNIRDLGSQNGTFLNDKRISGPKVKSDPVTLYHGDILSLGSCKFLLHVHRGHDTCDECEPGQVLAERLSQEAKPIVVSLSKEDKEAERRQLMKSIKSKYGLDYSSKNKKQTTKKGSDSNSGEKYEDKAELRRQNIGSENPYEKTESSSLESSMLISNKGYQMLKKLGWKEGDSLGIHNTGISEPITLKSHTGKTGLGCTESDLPAIAPDRRMRKWVKAQERYLQL